jgi:uncharacterized protein YyaL (SSP411 family)
VGPLRLALALAVFAAGTLMVPLAPPVRALLLGAERALATIAVTWLLLRAIDLHLADTKEVALVGETLDELAAVVRAVHRPHLVLAGGSEGTSTPPLLESRSAVDGKPTAYVCEHFACQAPVTDPKQLDDLL